MGIGLTAILLVLVGKKIAFMPAVTLLQLIKLLWIQGMTAVWLDQVGKEMAIMPEINAYCYITLIWKLGLAALLLIQCREEIAVMPAVTAVLIHRSHVDAETYCSVDTTG